MASPGHGVPSSGEVAGKVLASPPPGRPDRKVAAGGWPPLRQEGGSRLRQQAGHPGGWPELGGWSEVVGELPSDAVGVLAGDVVAGEAGWGMQQLIQGPWAGPGPLVLEVRCAPHDQ